MDASQGWGDGKISTQKSCPATGLIEIHVKKKNENRCMMAVHVLFAIAIAINSFQRNRAEMFASCTI